MKPNHNVFVEACLRCHALVRPRVTDSRPTSLGRWRRRACPACAYRWNTFEFPIGEGGNQIGRRLQQTVTALDRAQTLLAALVAEFQTPYSSPVAPSFTGTPENKHRED